MRDQPAKKGRKQAITDRVAMGVERIISGGQTGADRGGLDAAMALSIPHGGWCPKGRRAEDGQVPACYHLDETESVNYQSRTKRNVLETDGTVIFSRGHPTGGSLFTALVAPEAGKPCLQLDIREINASCTNAVTQFRSWISKNGIRTLNVAGSRESHVPGMQTAISSFLVAALRPRRVQRAYPMEDEQMVVDRPHSAAAEKAARYGGHLNERPRKKRRRT